MGNHPRTLSREYREGWTGRRHRYLCRICGRKFQHDGGHLPEKARICNECYLGYEAARKQYALAFGLEGAIRNE